MGHEIVGETLDATEEVPAGTRVVISPVLNCVARGVEPWCENCKNGDLGRCDRVTAGHVRAGLQTGYCKDTGGGWSKMLVAHRSQLHPIPDGMSDRTAVLIEPLACAVHTALRARVQPNDDVVVVGAGSIGTLVLLALKELSQPGRVLVVAKHARQRDWAERLGATDVIPPEEIVNEVRRTTAAMKLRPEMGQPFLLGGVDISIDCAGSKSSLGLALRITKAGGRVVLAGIPEGGPDLTPLWFRELELVGAYTGGIERIDGEERHAFEIAIDIASRTPMLDEMVGATYPLRRWREAVDHAMSAGKLGTLKVAFDPRLD
jgi:threonine dehydrogenase-like Zn-dependent dehydrogenase